MANQLDLITQTQTTPRYEFLDFGEYDETQKGVGLLVRVNPTREQTELLKETWEIAKSANEDTETVNKANDQFARIAASLIPADDERLDADAPAIDSDQFAAWVRNAKDPAFGAWVLKSIYLKVTAHFLAPNASRNISRRGRVQ